MSVAAGVNSVIPTVAPTAGADEGPRNCLVSEDVFLDSAPALATGWQAPGVLKMIGRLAVKWSLDNPDLREDLFQEGCIAAWQTELDQPGCPASHMVRRAEERMTHVRHLGHSVDGKAHAHYNRPRVYQLLSLNQPVRDTAADARTLVEQVPSQVRDVAEEVCGLLHAAAFLGTIPPLERRILSLRLVGFRWCELTRLLPLQPRALHARRAALRDSARGHWDPEVT
jgi:hypothetical protein